MIQIVRAKLHGLKVTGCDLDYHGSITLDPDYCARAGIYPLEFVDIWNKNSGARLSTYVIFGQPGSRCCILNGAAARTCQKGDEVIIAASAYIEPARLCDYKPRVLTFKGENEIDEILEYRVSEGGLMPYDFEIAKIDPVEDAPQPFRKECAG